MSTSKQLQWSPGHHISSSTVVYDAEDPSPDLKHGAYRILRAEGDRCLLTYTKWRDDHGGAVALTSFEIGHDLRGIGAAKAVAEKHHRERLARINATSSTSAKPAVRLTLRDRERGHISLTLRDGIVVGAAGSEPKRFMGLSEAQARHLARYGGSSSKPKTRAAGSTANLEQIREMQDMLLKAGIDEEHASRLQQEGMGPFELAGILSIPSGVGSLEYTHGIKKKSARQLEAELEAGGVALPKRR